MTIKQLHVSCCIGLMAGFLSSNALALDMLEAYQQARQNDANYMTALANYEAAKLDLPLAKTANRPGVTAALGVQHNDDTLNPDDAPSLSADYEQGQLGVALDQNLYSKSINYDIESATIAVDIARLQLGITEQELITTTISLYLDVLAALDNQRLAELEKAAIGQQLDLATQRLEVGLGTRTDQYDAQARFEGANAELIAAQNEVINAQQALEAQMGMQFAADAKEEMRRLDNDKVVLDLVEGEAWVAEVLPRNLAYQIKQRQVDLQEVEVARAEDARWPTLGLFADANAFDSGTTAITSGRDSQNWTVGVTASMPLYLGGSIKIRQEKAGHAQNAAGFEAEQSRRDTDRLIRAARRGAISLQRQAEARKVAAIAARSAVESKEEGFKAGVNTNIQVLDAQRDLFRAGRDYLRTSYDIVNALVVLERASGQLDVDDVEALNSWLK